MLAAADVVAHSLPAHFNSPEPLRILLTLLVAEDEGHSTATTDLSVKGRTQALTSRWIAALVKEGLVELSADQLGLTSLGYHKVTGMIEDVYSAQRLLD